MWIVICFAVVAVTSFFILYLVEALENHKGQRILDKEYENKHNKKVLSEFVEKIIENYSGYDTTDKCWYVYLTNEELIKAIDYFLEDRENDE